MNEAEHADSGKPENSNTSLPTLPPAPMLDPLHVLGGLAQPGSQPGQSVKTLFENFNGIVPGNCLVDALERLQTVMEKTGKANWERGDAMLAVKGTMFAKSQHPHLAKFFRKGAETVNSDAVVAIVSSWSPDYAKGKKQHYECIAVAEAFPVSTRLTAELTHTDHCEVLRAVNYLKKRKWDVGWSDGSDVYATRHKHLYRVAEAKACANNARMKFGRAEIEQITYAKFCLPEHLDNAINRDIEKRAKKLLATVDAATAEEKQRNTVPHGWLTMYRVDAPDEDAIFYIVAADEAAARHWLSDSETLAASMGRVNLKAGPYRLDKFTNLQKAKST